eukprot:Skav214852  [mRNA]  locus=scaffold16:208598:208840:+ [translate_table: standard]
MKFIGYPFSSHQEQFKKHAGADQALDQKELATIWIKVPRFVCRSDQRWIRPGGWQHMENMVDEELMIIAGEPLHQDLLAY